MPSFKYDLDQNGSLCKKGTFNKIWNANSLKRAVNCHVLSPLNTLDSRSNSPLQLLGQTTHSVTCQCRPQAESWIWNEDVMVFGREVWPLGPVTSQALHSFTLQGQIPVTEPGGQRQRPAPAPSCLRMVTIVLSDTIVNRHPGNPAKLWVQTWSWRAPPLICSMCSSSSAD